PPDCQGGTITEDTTWLLSQSPVSVCSNLTIASNVTLTIQPGVVVRFESGVSLAISDGGRLLADGSDTNHITFTGMTGYTRWSGIVVNGSPRSSETRITHADFELNGTTAIHSIGGTVFLDYLNFAAT